MKIKMKTLMAGPGGTRLPDRVYDVSPAEAKALIDGGYAVEVKEVVKAEAPAEVEPPEDGDPSEVEQAERSSRSGSRKAVKST